MCSKIRTICALVAIICFLSQSYSHLIFPRSSVLQITMSLSTPVFAPNHKIYCDWGFQMNYDLPYNLTYFYMIPQWSGIFNKRDATEIDHTKYQTPKAGVHPSDFSAGELYVGLEDLLMSYGFHETCLLKSVCELSKHPFHDDEQNLLTEIVTFILSPSMHEAFASKEDIYKEAYEEAEKRGFLGGDCDAMYPLCKEDFLSMFSKIMTKGALAE